MYHVAGSEYFMRISETLRTPPVLLGWKKPVSMFLIHARFHPMTQGRDREGESLFFIDLLIYRFDRFIDLFIWLVLGLMGNVEGKSESISEGWGVLRCPRESKTPHPDCSWWAGCRPAWLTWCVNVWMNGCKALWIKVKLPKCNNLIIIIILHWCTI